MKILKNIWAWIHSTYQKCTIFRYTILVVALVLLILGAAYLISKLTQKLIISFESTPELLLQSTIFLAILFAISYPVLKKNGAQSNWIENNQGFFVVLGLFITMIVFIFQQQQSVSTKNKEAEREYIQFIQNERALKQENTNNENLIKTLLQDFRNDPNTIFLDDSLEHRYLLYLTHIQSHYSSDCLGKYYQAMTKLEALKNLNKMRRDPNSILNLAKTSQEMISFASSSQPVFEELKQCEGIALVPVGFEFPKMERINPALIEN